MESCLELQRGQEIRGINKNNNYRNVSTIWDYRNIIKPCVGIV